VRLGVVSEGSSLGVRNTRLGGRIPGRRRKALAAVAGAILALVVFPALSGADASTPPDVTVGAITGLTSTAATLNGTVNPNDAANGASYTFSWGTSSLYGTDVTGTTAPGTTPQDVSTTLGPLTPGTTYHYELCAISTSIPSGAQTCNPSGDQSFTTPTAPGATTGNASSITQTGATLGGTVDPNGDATTYTFSWGLSSGNLTVGSVSDSAGSGTSPVSVSKTISGLSSQTTYYYQLCATSNSGSACGLEKTFFTPDVPAVTTGSATGISQTGATLNGTVNPNGATASYTFSYGTSPGTYDHSVGGTGLTGTTAQSVSRAISSLSPATTYYYQLCASNSFSVNPSCDIEKSFVTTSPPPTATTGASSSVTATGATLAGTVNPNGDATTFKFYYGTSSSFGTSYPHASAGGSAGSGTSATPVSDSISGLAGNTTYFFRLCATNTTGTSCSSVENTFTTPAAPVATTGASSSVTRTGASLAGTVDPNGDSTSWSFYYGTSSSTGTSYPNSSTGGNAGSGTSATPVNDTLSGLSGKTTYFYRLCATNAYGTNCGAESSFSTPDVPEVTTGAATAVSQTGATLNGTVDPNGATTSYTFSYGTSPGTYDHSIGGSGLTGTTPQSVSKAISSLSPATTYYYQLCATNAYSVSASCGIEKTFLTTSPPTVTTGAFSSVTSTGASVAGTVNPHGDSTSWKFYFGTSSSTGTSYPRSSTGGNAGSGNSATPVNDTLTALSGNTTYFYRLCATNSTATACGGEGSFTTPAAPVATTGASSSVTRTGASLAGTVDPNGDSTSWTFYYGTSSSTGTSYPNSSTGGNAGSGTSPTPVNDTLSGLSGNTTYFYRLCATNTYGTNCGGESSFSTPDLPAVVTGAASSVTKTGASLAGTVNPNRDSTSWKFYYGTSSSTGTSYPNSSTGGNAGSGTSATPVNDTLSGLSGDTTYFYRLCATNTFGTTCGGEGSFLTQDAPTPVTGAASAVTTNNATLAGTVNPNGATVSSTVFRYGTSCSAPSWTTGCSSATASPSPGSGRTAVSVSATLSGLQAGTTFHYTLCATNTYGTNCDASDHTFKTNTPPTAALVPDKTGGPTPLTVTFDGSGSSDSDGTIQSWSITFGDGGSASGTGAPGVAFAAHTYNTACNCNAVLTVTDNVGATGSISVGIHVTTNQVPVASLVVTPASGTVPVNVSFDGSASVDPDNIPLKSWSLDFADGSTPAAGTGAVPNAIPHTYTAPGTYNAKLTVVDSSNASASKTVTVTVNPQPTITIANASATEGQPENFLVTLSAVSTHDITVDYVTVDGTATAADYTPVTGTLTISAGACGPSSTACKISVATTDDKIFENNETFSVVLSNPKGATIATGTATATIIDNDPQPVVIIGNSARLEGNAGSTISTSQTWADGGSLTVNDASGFSAGPGRPFYITTPGDKSTSPAGPYSFAGKTGNTLTGVSPAGSAASGQIAFQPVTIGFDVLLCDAATSGADADHCVRTVSGTPTTIQYTTVDGVSDSLSHAPVKSGQDYVAACSVVVTASCIGPLGPPITINPGESSATVDVTMIGNTIPQDTTRHFTLRLLSAVNASIRWPLGAGTIIDDDAPNAPTATTSAASDIGTDHASVGGTVNPKGQATTAFIVYGKTAGYGGKTAVVSLPADSNDHGVLFSLTGLSPDTTYHYQVIAQHADNGTGYGDDATFKTLPTPVRQPTPNDFSIGANPASLKIGLGQSGTSTISTEVASGSAETVHLTVAGAPAGATVNFNPSAVTAGGSSTMTVSVGNTTAPGSYTLSVKGTSASNSHPVAFALSVQPHLVPNTATLNTRAATPTTKGVLPLKFTCKGNSVKRCTVTIFIDFSGTSLAKKKASLVPGKQSVVLIKLSRKAFALLLRKKRLRVDVGYSVADGQGVTNFDDTPVTLNAPRMPAKSKVIAPKRK
jgi:phosphodiesterase/alkaline phosphatase D-like protein